MIKNTLKPTVLNTVLLWMLFSLICMGLGYSTLNRYDPRMHGGTIDSAHYYEIVAGDPQDAVGRWRYRVLVPYLAKPFYWLAKGRVGTWDPVLFGLLVANSILSAMAATLLAASARKVEVDQAVATLAGALYLLNFSIPNYHLAGLVDSGEGCLLLAVTFVLLAGRWWLLMPLGVLGAAAKETFVPIAGVFAGVWWLGEIRKEEWCLTRLLSVVAMSFAGLATVVLIQSTVSGHMVWPWEMVAAEHMSTNHWISFRGIVFSKGFLYVFVWLLPLGVWRLPTLPRPWVAASFFAALIALSLGVVHNAGNNVARALFNAAGPVLNLSVAMLLTGYRMEDRGSREEDDQGSKITL